MNRKFTLVFTVFFMAFCINNTKAQAPSPPPGSYTTSWLGNTYFDNSDKKVVTEELNSLCLSPNGIVFTAGYAEAFGGGASYNAADGGFAGRYGNTNSGFGDPLSVVGADNEYVYFGSGIGILRAPHGGAQGGYTQFLNDINVQGLYIKNGKLYVSDFGNKMIRVLDVATMNEITSWPCPNPTRLAVDNAGNVWVVRWDSTSTQPPSDGPMWWGDKLLSFSSTGTPGVEITDFERPLCLAIDNSGQLLVGGFNENSQIWSYNISGTPVRGSNFGVAGGIFSGTSGEFTNTPKLHWIKAIAVDASNNIYTGCTYGTFWGNCVEKFNAAGTLQWRLFAGTSLDCAGIDPDNETEVYSKYHHYSLDYSKTAPGTEWSLKGFTVNRYKYPNDPRVDQNTDVGSRSLGAGAFRIGGKLFMARSSQEGYRWELYRQATTTAGEVFIPSVIMGAGGDANNQFYNATTKTWYNKPKKDNLYNQYFAIAKNGDIFTVGDDNNLIIQYPFGGFDENNNPIWDASTATTSSVPEFTYDVRRLYYDSDADIMYITGDEPPGEWGTFLKIRRFDRWSTGNRTSSYTVTLPYNDVQYTPETSYGGGQPTAFSVAGDYMFVLYGYGHVRVMDNRTGQLIGTLTQNTNGWLGGGGQVDASYGMTASKLSSGEYIIFFENAGWANIMMYRWQPPADGVLYLTSPQDGKEYKVGPLDSIPISAFIKDSANTIAKVAFYDGSTIIKEDSSAPYEFNWQASVGSHSVSAISYNFSGTATDTSSIANITVTPLPDLLVTHVGWLPVNPRPGDTLTFQATIKNIGNGPTPANVTVGGLFSVDDNLVNYTDNFNSSIAPGDSVTLTASGGWSIGNRWALPSAGSYKINFVVDDVNRIQESNESNNTLDNRLCVDTTGGLPSVKITEPLNGDSIAIGDDLVIKASTLDCTGTITKLSFYQNNVLLGEVTDGSNKFTWTNVQAGTYQLKIVATDNNGNVATSSFVVVHVTSQVILPKPLVKLDFNENGGTAIANHGSAQAMFTRTQPIPAWSTNVPMSGDSASVDFGTTVGDYAVESNNIISELTGLQSFTITGWLNCRDNAEGGGGNRVVSWINNGGDGVDLVYKEDGNLQIGVNQWSDADNPPRSSAGKITTDANAVCSNWKYFAVTYDAKNKEVKYYFGDANKDASLDVVLPYDRGAVASNIAKLAIGHFNDATRQYANDRMFRGLIDKIRIYGRALKPSQVVYNQRRLVALPVTLASFSVTPQCSNGMVKINWRTETELNNKYFTVERSGNGIEFKKLSQIEGAGNSATSHYYTFSDKAPLAGINYYRLKQTDIDGKETYSLVATSSCSSQAVVVFPNPATDKLNILLSGNTDAGVIKITSINGRLIAQNTFKTGDQSSSINTTYLQRGVYILEILSKGLNFKTKFIKK